MAVRRGLASFAWLVAGLSHPPDDCSRMQLAAVLRDQKNRKEVCMFWSAGHTAPAAVEGGSPCGAAGCHCQRLVMHPQWTNKSVSTHLKRN